MAVRWPSWPGLSRPSTFFSRLASISSKAVMRVLVLAARMRPSCARFSAFHWEGRGECRVPTHPQPRMQSKKAYELVTTGKPDDPAFPHRNGFNGFLRDLPGDRA